MRGTGPKLWHVTSETRKKIIVILVLVIPVAIFIFSVIYKGLIEKQNGR